jgi:hypothetical protein
LHIQSLARAMRLELRGVNIYEIPPRSPKKAIECTIGHTLA